MLYSSQIDIVAVPVTFLLGGHGNRKFVLWSALFLAMAETACNKGPQSSQQGKTPQEVAAGRETKAPLKELTVDLGGGVKLEMILIPAWEFMMGSPDSDKNVLVHEKPQHRVRITKPFYLGEYLVTFAPLPC